MGCTIPRLEFDQLPPGVAGLLRAKFERLGYLGEFFARAAHNGPALEAFIRFTDEAKGGLDMRLVELIALTIAAHKRVAYELHQHERLSVKLGYGRDWVAAVERLDPGQAPGLSDDERAIQRFVLASLESDGRGTTPLLDALVARLGHEAAVSVLLVMGRYVMHAMLVNCMDIGAPVPSIFDEAAAR